MAAPPSALCALSLRDALPILTGALGTVAEQQAGVYTGRLVGEMLHGPGKAVAVEELAAREGLDITRCYAYSDSAIDMPLLKSVGSQCVLNLDLKMWLEAMDIGCQIREYRSHRTHL